MVIFFNIMYTECNEHRKNEVFEVAFMREARAMRVYASGKNRVAETRACMQATNFTGWKGFYIWM